MRRAWLAGACVVVLLAGCDGVAVDATPGQDAATTAPTPDPTTPATPTASAQPTPSASPSDGDECEPEPPTALSDDWEELTGVEGHYRFSHPPDWEAREPTTLPIFGSISPDTFEETGFPEVAEHAVDLVIEPGGRVGVSAWVIDARIETSTDELFERELAWLEEQPQVDAVLETGLEFCVDGEPALGFESMWIFPSGERFFLIYTLQRNGRIYQVQLNAEDDGDAEILHEVLRTWSWTGPAAASDDDQTDEVDGDFAATDIRMAGIATDPDLDLPAPVEPADLSERFVDVVPADAAAIYLVYQLDQGAADTIHFTWRHEGEVVNQSEFAYAEDNTYAWSFLTPGSGGFATGAWEVEMDLEGSGDRVTIAFTVED